MSKIHLLEADSIRKSYGDRSVLSDVYFSCKTNEIVGVVGRNGAGKSTLLRIIFGELGSLGGVVHIDKKYYGQPFRKMGIMAYLPQESMLPGNTSIKRIIRSFVPRVGFEEIASDPRILPHMGKKASQLSGGERKYIEVKMLLALKRKFLIFDEPFNGIEPIYREHIAHLLKSAKSSSGIIISDHDYRNVIGISNRLYLISSGVCREIKNLVDLELSRYLPAGSIEAERLEMNSE